MKYFLTVLAPYILKSQLVNNRGVCVLCIYFSELLHQAFLECIMLRLIRLQNLYKERTEKQHAKQLH